MSVRAPVGDLNIAKDDTCIGRGLCSINFKQGNNEFLYYLLKYNILKLINQSTGTVFDSISKKDIENLELTLPPKTTQNQILKIIKSLDSKINILTKINSNNFLQYV